jgi:hypothetical protein
VIRTAIIPKNVVYYFFLKTSPYTGVKKYGKTVKRYENTPFSRSFSRFGTPIPGFQVIRPFYVVLAPFPVQNTVAKHVQSRVAIKPYINISHLFVCLN